LEENGGVPILSDKGEFSMKHVKTLNNANLKKSAATGGCGECQASCQSACKTSCTVANQKCEK
jgi:predicted ribosomally synthesized six-cysteine peptide SCIFF